MSKPFDQNNKTCKEKGCVRLIGNHCHARDNGKFLLFAGKEYPDCEFFEAPKKQTIFHKITASPEVLAPKLVYVSLFNACWYSTLTGDVMYKSREEAEAATVARLKEVCDE